MSFPVTGILDSFVRADESPLATSSSGAVWSTVGIKGSATLLLAVSADQAEANETTVTNHDQYLSGPYGPDSEVYVTIATLPASSDSVNCWLRLTNVGSSSVNGYRLAVIPQAHSVQMQRVDAGAFTQLGPTINQVVAAGNSVGISAAGGLLTSYINAGAWTALQTALDFTYQSAGALGLNIFDAQTARLTNFGGGTLLASQAGPPPLLTR